MTTSHEYLGLAGLLTRLAIHTHDPFERAELFGFADTARFLGRRRVTRLAAIARAHRLYAYGTCLSAHGHPVWGRRFQAAAVALADADL